jgi:hypothetical protein
MIKMRRNKKAQTKTENQEQEVQKMTNEAHDPTEIMDTETYIEHVKAEESAKEETPNETPVFDAPIIEDQPQVEKEHDKEPAAPKKKGVRYASIAVLANPNAVVTRVDPNPKRRPSDSYDLYQAHMLPALGKTLAQVEADFMETSEGKKLGRHRIRRLLRWDFAHKHIDIEAPAEVPQEPVVEAPPAPEVQQEPETPASE